MAHTHFPFAVLLGLALASSLGCSRLYPLAEAPDSSYFAVHYKVRAENEPRAVFEVKQADKFPALRATWNNAALRAPEHCVSESANKGIGAGAGRNVKLMTSCGFWLSELERVLVQSKFTVASWSALSDLERTKQVPAYVAARDLGADVVFVINSLENDYIKLGKNSRESFEVYDADEDGHASRRLPIEKATFDQVRSFVRTRMKPLTKEFQHVTTHLTATLDITAVDTKTGEAVWFYRKQEVKAQPIKLDRYFLFARSDKNIWPVQPHAFALAEREEARAARSASEMSDHDSLWLDFKAPPDDAQAEEANLLARAVVADFLARFRGG
ncbi:MAG TPA: hypothetical protein VM580_32810 [Labilithrix sp.]|nr:hypothetical protein [Labilithrix sp.]